MKNKKILVGFLVAVVIVGFAVIFGGNYFQGSISRISKIKPVQNLNTSNLKVTPVVTTPPDISTNVVLEINKADLTLTASTRENTIGSWTINNKSDKNIFIKDLSFQSSNPTVFASIKLYDSSGIQLGASSGYYPFPTGEIRVSDLDYKVRAGQSKTLIVKADMSGVFHDGGSAPQPGAKASIKLNSVNSVADELGGALPFSASADTSYGQEFAIADDNYNE